MSDPEDGEGLEVVEAVGRTFSLRAVLALLATTAGVSGFGGAATVAAQDAVQDQRILATESEIAELRRQVATVTSSVDKIEATVDGLDQDVDEIKGDTKEALRLLNQVIGRAGRER